MPCKASVQLELPRGTGESICETDLCGWQKQKKSLSQPREGEMKGSGDSKVVSDTSKVTATECLL